MPWRAGCAALLAAALLATAPALAQTHVPLVVLRADSASGSGPYPIPGAASPWIDLRGGHHGTLASFEGSLGTGWRGDGSPASPYRLEYSGRGDRVTIPGGSVPELQSVAPVTAMMWFKTGFDFPSAEIQYLLEWLQVGDRGMSIAVQNGKLMVYFNPWAEVATLTPDTWYHVAVSKDLDSVRVYLDGARVYAGSEPFNGIQTTPIGIGCSTYRVIDGTGDFDDYWKGSIAQVAIWSGALDAGEVLARFEDDRARYLPNPTLPDPAKAVELRGDHADGAAPYPAPGAGSPWVDLAAPRADAALQGFDGTAASGWAGTGVTGDAHRLVFDGVNDVAVIPAGAVSELQTAHALTAEMWVRTSADVTSLQYWIEWLDSFGLTPGMSVATENGHLQIYTGAPAWLQVAPVAPDTWYHLAVAKQPGEMRVYLNGTRVATSATPHFGEQTTAVALGASVYRGPGQYGEFLRGEMGQATLWNGALGDSAAAAAYQSDRSRYESYTLSASAGAGGSIVPSGAVTVPQHGAQSFTITPALHDHVVDVRVDGVSVGPVTGHDFTDVVRNHTIVASFAVDTHVITAGASAGGSVTPSGAVVVPEATDTTFTITPDLGHHVVDVQVDGVSVGPVASYTFTDVMAAHTLFASFAIDTHTLSTSAVGAGAVARSPDQPAYDYGTPVTLTATADSGYTFTGWSGSASGATNPLTVTMNADLSITATFTRTFVIAAVAGAHGSVSPVGAVPALIGSSPAFAIAPDLGYHVADVRVDGVSVGPVTGYTFTDVQADHTLEATFAIDTHALAITVAGVGSVAREPDLPAYDYGTGVRLVASPGAGHAFVGWSGDTSAAGDTLALVMVRDRAVTATFVPLHTVIAIAGPHGAIAPQGTLSVPEGDTLGFAITPDPGYHVADVLVDGVSVGAVAAWTFPGITADHRIEAAFAINTYALGVATLDSGAVVRDPDLALYDHGTAVTLTAVPAVGRSFVEWGGDTAATANPLALTMTRDRSLTARFAIDTFTIVASAGPDGAVVPSGAVRVTFGADTSFAITPAAGHHVADVAVDGASVGAVPAWTFADVASDHTLHARFAIDSFTIVATAGEHGAVAPSGNVIATWGSTVTFSITPETGYHVAEVRVDDASVGAPASYTFTDVTAGHTLAASFAIDTFVIVASADTHGTVTPGGTVVVDYGRDTTFTLTPESGYRVRDVLVDGMSVGPVTAYTFTNVIAAHTLAAKFSPIPYPVVVLRADSANGSTHYPIPGGGSPWRDLRHGHDAVLENFPGTLADGWNGAGTLASPYRLELTGHQQRALIPAGSVPELQTLAPVTAFVWFLTGEDGPQPVDQYLLEWLAPGDRGMSIAVRDGRLRVYLNGWVDVAALAPHTWYHVGVAKELDEVRVYVDGARVFTGPDPFLGTQVTPVGIGTATYRIIDGTPNSYGDYFVGAFGQVEIWRGALTDAEAAARFGADQAGYLPNPPLPVAERVVELRADRADGTGPYPVPGSTSPWKDLAGVATDATLRGFAGDSSGGWRGSGAVGDPVRLRLDGVDDVATIAAGAIAELQSPLAHTAELWARTPADVTTEQYLLEWLEAFGRTTGMSIEVAGGRLRLYLDHPGWADLGPARPNTWYHVAVAKQPGEVRAYVDGVRSLTAATPNLGDQGSELVLGGSTWRGAGAYGERFAGDLGQVSVWNGALDDVGAAAAYLADRDLYVRYAITASAGAGGSVSPSGTFVVLQNADTAVTVTPEPGHHVAGVTVDGVPVGALRRVALSGVVANHVVIASFAPNDVVAAEPPATCVSTAHPCVTVPVTITRPDSVPLHRFDVDVALSPGLALCVGTSSITLGGYLTQVATAALSVVDHGGGAYTVVGTITGLPCGATAASGTLFELALRATGADTAGTVSVTAVTLRGCDAALIAASPGPPAALAIDLAGPPAIADLTASQSRSGNGADSLTRIGLGFTPPSGAVAIEVYRAPFGNHPRYDDPPTPGSEPAPQPYPPSAPWQLTAVSAPGETDRPAARDVWYYVAYTRDACGNWSAVSNRAGGTLDYALGDVTDGASPGTGDGRVDSADVSLLGGHYGLDGGAAAPFAYLDIGPTTDTSPAGRPLTDGRIDFEDLVILAIDYGSLTASPLAGRPAPVAEGEASEQVTLMAPASVNPGAPFEVAIRLQGSGLLQALSVRLACDTAVAVPVSVTPGTLTTGADVVLLSPAPGTVDGARLGVAAGGFAGDGEFARVLFRATAGGAPQVAIAEVRGRDAQNRPVPVQIGSAPVLEVPDRPLATRLEPAAPNPFPGSGTIAFSLANASDVDLAIFSVDGRRVRTLVREARAPGRYRVAWNGADDGGHPQGPGVYYVRLLADRARMVRRVTLLR